MVQWLHSEGAALDAKDKITVSHHSALNTLYYTVTPVFSVYDRAHSNFHMRGCDPTMRGWS